jgi:acyl-CoA synthetase (AMP-forming)/AMP-acid ligase II
LGWPITTSGADGIVCFLKTPNQAINGILNKVKNRLPEYMVPKQFYILEDFPMNANGKVDRNALIKILKE